MAKNSLIISEKQKYGAGAESMPATGAGVKGGKPSKPKARKFAPVIELTSDQIAAFGLESATQGQTGCAMIHYTVKSVSSGGPSYGDELPDAEAKSNERVTLSITHVDPDCEAPEGDEEGEDDDVGGEAEKDDETDEGTGGADEGDASTDDTEDDDDSPKAAPKEKVSPADALGDDE